MNKLLDGYKRFCDWMLDERVYVLLFFVSTFICIVYAAKRHWAGAPGGAAGFGAIAGCSLIGAALLRRNSS